MNNEIQKKIEILNEKPNFFNEKKGIQAHLKALDEIGEQGSVYDAQYIVKHVFSDNDLISRKTAAVIRKLFTRDVNHIAWLNLYPSFSYLYMDQEQIFDQNNLQRLSNFPSEEVVHLYGILSLNHSGYVRETALNYLEQLRLSEAFPYILLRLNDWVPEVQAKAREVFETIFSNISITELIKYQKLIEWLNKAGRVELSDIQQKILQKLCLPENRKELLSSMQSEPVKGRLFCWKTLSKEIAKDDFLIDKILNDKAPEIRQWAAQNLLQDQYLNPRFDKLFSDKAVRVRYAALKAIPENRTKAYQTLFQMAVFDDSSSIRQYAQFVLRSLGEDKLVEKYREMLKKDQENPAVGIISGLSETGNKQDIALIQSYFKHRNGKIRAAALSGLNHLKADDIELCCLEGLKDNSGKVRNIGVLILQSHFNDLRPQLRAILEKSPLKSKKAALKVLIKHDALEGLQDILFALTKPCEELQALAWKYFDLWHRQYATRLWFPFHKNTYETIHQLIKTLRISNIEIPLFAKRAWLDLPNIMDVLRARL